MRRLWSDDHFEQLTNVAEASSRYWVSASQSKTVESANFKDTAAASMGQATSQNALPTLFQKKKCLCER